MRTLICIFLLLPFYCLAQTPRLQLIEVFGDEDYYLSKKTEPALDILLQQNQQNVIKLQYEITSMTGTGIIATVNTIDPSDRQVFYNNFSNYYGLQDGKLFHDPANIHNGYLQYLTQNDINNRSATMSPFSIALSHSFSAMFDTVYVTATVTASMNYDALDSTTGNIRFRLALAERNINVKDATGTSGQTDYFMVMRNMMPSANGFLMQNHWVNGQSQTFTTSYPLNYNPLYNLYDYAQICFVGFIQDDGYGHNTNSNSILQAAYDPPIPNAPANIPDLGIENNTPFPAGHCFGQFTPTYKLTNHGQVPIYAAQIAYTQNNWANSVSANFNGNLLPDSSTIITFPTITTSMSHIQEIGKILSVNGYNVGNSTTSFATNHDFNCSNNLSDSHLDVDYTLGATKRNSFTEDFEGLNHIFNSLNFSLAFW